MFSTVMVMVRVNADICVRNRPKINSNLLDYLRRVFRFFCFADVYPYALLCFFLMVPLVGEYGFIQHTDATKPQPHNDVSCSYVFLFLITRLRKMLVQKLASSESGLARDRSR